MSLYTKLNFSPSYSKVKIEQKTETMSLSLDIAEEMLIKFDGTRNKLCEFIGNCL